MKLKTIDFSLVTLIISFAISSVHAETVQLDFRVPAPGAINCEDNPNGISCIELESNLLVENQGMAPNATDFQALQEIQEGTPLPVEMLTDTQREARCVSDGGSTAATGSVGGFCVASDLRTSATDFAAFAVANDELPVTRLQFLQVTLRNGSTLVGSRELLGADAPMGAVCASVGGSTAATGNAGGFCLAADLASDSPSAAFAVANDLPVAGMHFVQVTFRGTSQIGEARLSANAEAAEGAECNLVNGSTATTGNAGGFCLASDLSTSTLGVANFSVANDFPAEEMHFLQVTFGDSSTAGELPSGAECVSVGGSNANAGDNGVSCLASDLNPSTTGDANIAIANDLPIAGMQFLQATFGDDGQLGGSRPGPGNRPPTVPECVSDDGSVAVAGSTEGFCLVSDRISSIAGLGNFSVANGIPVSALHFLQVPLREENQLGRLGFLLGDGAPMGVVISDSARARLLRRSLPVLGGIVGHDNRYFRILRGRSGIEIRSSPNQSRRLRPAFWRSR